MSKTGRPKSEDPARHFVNVRMTDARFNRLKAYAELYNQTMTEIVVTAVEEYLDKRESESGGTGISTFPPKSERRQVDAKEKGTKG